MNRFITAVFLSIFAQNAAPAQQCNDAISASARLSAEVQRIMHEFDANNADVACQSMKNAVAFYEHQIVKFSACETSSATVNVERSIRLAHDTVVRICEIVSEWPDFISHMPRKPIVPSHSLLSTSRS